MVSESKLRERYLRIALETSDRWGANNMPELEWVFELLLKLPVDRVRMEANDEITVWLTRSLSMREAFEFHEKMTPDRLKLSEYGEIPMFINVWWD
jgi:hypothetical protein